MKRKYNIAYLPQTKSREFIALANQFSGFSAGYLLGEKALPHLTLCQFVVDEKKVDLIWYEVCELLRQKEIELGFKEFSYILKNNMRWISLLPNKMAEVREAHKLVVQVVKNPLGRVLAEYEPHLTLINTLSAECAGVIRDIEGEYEAIEDQFRIGLGVCDEIGQVVEVLSVG